jgi:FkbM family methyltransferase
MTSQNLIFDIGMHHGLDSEFYLLKGFRVVAVEANPLLVQAAREKFASYLQSGQLVIVDAGIWHSPGSLIFYRNLDKDDWSSFRRGAGTRNGTRFEEIAVECITIGALLSRYGLPYYMKIDVEGADKIILNDMARLEARPQFMSAEEYGVDVIRDMSRLGYDQFQIIPQAGKCQSVPPIPAREGTYVQRRFSGHDSGLFGLELPHDKWMSYGKAEREFLTSVRDENYRHVGIEGQWYDVHAGYASQIIS